MRERWVKRALGDVCTLQRGFDLPKKQREQGPYPLISSSGPIDFHNEAKVRGPGVVTGRSGSIGAVFYIAEDFWPLNTALYIKDFHGNLPRFIFHLLSKFELHRFTTGAGVPTLNRNNVHSEPVFIPTSLPEQKRIVAILDEAFAAIATATANTEKNLANAREFVDRYMIEALSQKGDGWREKYLKDVSLEFGRGRSKHRPRNEPSLYGGAYPFIQTGDISGADHWITEYSQTYSERGLAQSRLWPSGTICIAIVGATVGETGILNFEACFPDSVIGIVVKEELADCEYVDYLLQTFKPMLKEKGKGTARDNINLGTFDGQRFPFPPLKQQKAIVSTLNDLRANKQNLTTLYRDRQNHLSNLKQAILHKAFTGELTADPKAADRALNEAGL